MKEYKKALKAIEILVSGDFPQDLEWVLVEHRKDIKDPFEMLKKAAMLISQVYRISHAEGDCSNHADWLKEKDEILKNEI